MNKLLMWTSTPIHLKLEFTKLYFLKKNFSTSVNFFTIILKFLSHTIFFPQINFFF